MTRPSVYVTVLRTLIGLVFVIGSTVHLRLLTDTRSYQAFGDTAWPPLDTLWTSFVMPNIGWLALCMAVFELAVGVLAWLPGRLNRLSALAITGFFIFLLFLGYAFPTNTLIADLLINRLGSVVMIALLVPWLVRPQYFSVPTSWRAIVRRRGHRVAAVPRTRSAGVRRVAVLTMEFVIVISAFGGGIAMIADPAGAMGFPPEMLDRLPVDSWLLPGVALIVCNGVLPIVVATAELRGHAWPRRFGHVLVGMVLLAWPVTETLIFGYPLANEPVWLRPAVATIALALIVLGLALRRHDRVSGSSASRQSMSRPAVPVGP